MSSQWEGTNWLSKLLLRPHCALPWSVLWIEPLLTANDVKHTRFRLSLKVGDQLAAFIPRTASPTPLVLFRLKTPSESEFILNTWGERGNYVKRTARDGPHAAAADNRVRKSGYPIVAAVCRESRNGVAGGIDCCIIRIVQHGFGCSRSAAMDPPSLRVLQCDGGTD